MREEPPEDYERRDFNNLMAAIAVIVIIVLGCLVVFLIQRGLDRQRCAIEHRLSCNEIVLPPH